MKQSLTLRFLCLLLWLLSLEGYSQQSLNTVSYRLTYDPVSSQYTAWVVPEYSLPNANNTGTTEKGATAQVTLAVPSSFLISNITSVNGIWSSSPMKLGPGQPNQDWSSYSLPANTNYYVIGKSADETDYGSFVSGTPVALFTFQGQSCVGVVRIIEPNEPFITAADAAYSFNVANSFYSRSGQPAGGNQVPLEQFRAVSGSAANCNTSLVAVADNASTPAGVSKTISVLTNDTQNGSPVNPSNVTLTVTQFPPNGAVTVNADGTLSYTPNPGFVGTDCLEYRICDKTVTSLCSTASVCVSVTGSTVVATPDSPSTTKGTPTTTSVLSNDTNGSTPASPSNSTLSISQTPTNGTVLVNANGTITYTPNANFVGTDCYVYRLCDKTVTTACDTAKVCVVVTDTPVAKQIYAFDDNNVTNQNTAVSGNVLTNDLLNTGTGPLLVTTVPVQPPAHGTVTLTPNGSYTYTPSNGFSGTDTFSYQVCDSSSPKVCDQAVVNIEVKSPPSTSNNPPIALGDKAVLKTGTTYTGNVLTNDADPDAGQTLTATVVSNPTHGTLTLNANGTFTYTPAAGYVGPDSFTYKTCDNGTPSLCDQALVDITVYAADVNNAPPVANDDLYTRLSGQNVSGNVKTNDYSPVGLALTVKTSPITAPTKGTLTLNADGSFTYIPSASFDGFDSFVYQVCDNATPQQCSQATAFIVGQTTTTTDLTLKKMVNKSGSVNLNETISYTIVVKNNGQATATNIVITDELPVGLTFVSAQSSKGTWSNPTWSIAALAVGDSAYLVIQAKVGVEGVTTNTASITHIDQTDSDPSDNQASVCVSVPIILCQGQSIQVSVPSSYSDVKWYKDGVMVGTGNVLSISQAGNYTITASNSTCPAQGCCPIQVITQVCCPTNVCVPLSIKKIR